MLYLSFIHLVTSPILLNYEIHDLSTDGQCALNVSCTVRDRTVATGCVFVYDNAGDGTLDTGILINLPMNSNAGENHIIINCNLNQLNFTVRAVAGTTFSTAMPLGCPVSDPPFNLVTSRGKQQTPLLLRHKTCRCDPAITIGVHSRIQYYNHLNLKTCMKLSL